MTPNKNNISAIAITALLLTPGRSTATVIGEWLRQLQSTTSTANSGNIGLWSCTPNKASAFTVIQLISMVMLVLPLTNWIKTLCLPLSMCQSESEHKKVPHYASTLSWWHISRRQGPQNALPWRQTAFSAHEMGNLTSERRKAAAYTMEDLAVCKCQFPEPIHHSARAAATPTAGPS